MFGLDRVAFVSAAKDADIDQEAQAATMMSLVIRHSKREGVFGKHGIGRDRARGIIATFRKRVIEPLRANIGRTSTPVNFFAQGRSS